MHIDWLEDFQTLADVRNFTLAAKRRNLSQAAFSRRIIALENWVGVNLVDRSQIPIKLTIEGQKFLSETRSTFVHLVNTKSALSNNALGKALNVRIAVPHVLSISRFSKWWSNWSTDTRTSVTLSAGIVSDVISQFMTGTAEILICHNARSLPLLLDPKYYLSYEIERDKFLPYAPINTVENFVSKFPGTADSPIPLVQYAKGAYFSRLVEMIIKRAPAQLNGITQVEADLSSVIRDCISQGFGIGWLPQSCVGSYYNRKMKPLNVAGWSEDLPIRAYIHKENTNPAALLIWEKITQSK